MLGLVIFMYGFFNFSIAVIIGAIIGIWIALNAEKRKYSYDERMWLFAAGILFSIITLILYMLFRREEK